MTTEKQLLANRANGLRSTGPRTEEGKRIASRNSVTHGLLAGDILIQGENAAQYEAFRQHLLTDLDPCGQMEVLLVERIIGFFWRLRRAGRMEQGLLDHLRNQPDRYGKTSRENGRSFELAGQQECRGFPEDTPEENKAALGRLIRSDLGGSRHIERLLRYEGQIERSLYRALTELQKLQHIRKRNEAIWVDPGPEAEPTTSSPEPLMK